MDRIDCSRRELDLHAFTERGAREEDCARLVAASAGLWHDGTLLAAYWELGDDPRWTETFDRMEWALPRIKYGKNARSSGMIATTRVFGFQPRVVIRRDYCTAASLAKEQPAEHHAIAAGSHLIDACYQSLNPDLYAAHQAETQRVRPEYHLEEDTPFTSGIINDNNPLRYHFDAGNFKNVWSGMLVFKTDIAGGYLAIPELDTAIELKHRSLFMFDGQGLLHGVTPIRKLSPIARRFSVVYYSLAGMWKCEPLTDELARIRKVREVREARRAATPSQPAAPDLPRGKVRVRPGKGGSADGGSGA